MRFSSTAVPGVTLVEPEPRGDARGRFARVYCREELLRAGLDPGVAQMNSAVSARRGTLRGLHYQRAPHGENKLVRCIRGRVFDVALDLRPHSPAHGRWVGVELAATDGRMLYVPAGCAHGYQVLEDDSEVLYTASAAYAPGAEAGVRWDDPAFAIEWPLADPILSEKDRCWPDFAIEFAG